jgi:hypothetical protein
MSGDEAATQAAAAALVQERNDEIRKVTLELADLAQRHAEQGQTVLKLAEANTGLGVLVVDLQAFKAYVHKRLDEAGVPADPEPERNRETGCRIEGRLNWVLSRLRVPPVAPPPALCRRDECSEVAVVGGLCSRCDEVWHQRGGDGQGTAALEAFCHETFCGGCGGEGKVADTEEGGPWSHWANLPAGSNAAVVLGVVKPIPCTSCKGTGRVGP